RVLLQVVALAGNVGRDLHRVGQAHTRDLAQSRVRLLRGGRVNACAHASLMRGAPQGRGLRLRLGGDSAFPDELVDGRHETPVFGLYTQTKAGKGRTLPTEHLMLANTWPATGGENARAKPSSPS